MLPNHSETIIQISNLNKRYGSRDEALKNFDLSVKKGEILALLGPNGAGKTTLISIICGIVNATSGKVNVAGYDIVKDYRKTREMIGLVPQELTLSLFKKVISAVQYSRGVNGKAPNKKYIETLLKDLSLWHKRDSQIRHLSGGMKRRVLIAKALSHEPDILFLDEPTAGVDVELRKDMWKIVEQLRQRGVTIILTTHYIEEAEAIADRIGIMRQGNLLVIEEKASLLQKMGTKNINLQFKQNLSELPERLANFLMNFKHFFNIETNILTIIFNSQNNQFISQLLTIINASNLEICDIQTSKSSLEDIFINFVINS